ncbi:MAG: cupin-like domain-containing protein [Woeseia sp.]
MAITEKKTRVLDGCDESEVPWQELMATLEPVVLKGLVSKWPLVKTGRQSSQDAIAYLHSFYNGKTVGTLYGEPEIKGRFFYNDDITGLNFESRRSPLDEVLATIQKHLRDERPPSVYVGSTTIDACLPGLRRDNDLVFDDEMFADNAPLASIWLGNRSLASAHYDAPNNIACCAVGHRRYTLFPPEQIWNLYPGPLDPTPGGQAISMVDFANPDFARYPRFREAVAAARVADLEPGDALFYPSMWWHQVEAFDPFNVLINYWWSTSPKFMGTPMNVLKHALLSLRDRPEHEKSAWKHVFDYYVFGSPERAREHLPEQAQGDLGPIDDLKARRLRAELLNKLNR